MDFLRATRRFRRSPLVRRTIIALNLAGAAFVILDDQIFALAPEFFLGIEFVTYVLVATLIVGAGIAWLVMDWLDTEGFDADLERRRLVLLGKLPERNEDGFWRDWFRRRFRNWPWRR